jgi:hypothetical protein
MNEVDIQAIRLLGPNLKMWRRYVDDVLALLRSAKWQDTLRDLNSINSSIQFTMELEKSQKLPFLDLEISRNGNGEMSTKVYRKATHSGSYTHYTSEHAYSQKMSVVSSLAYRAFTYCDKQEDQEKEVELITKELMGNGYPKVGITKVVKKVREKMLLPVEQEEEFEQKKTVSIPFIEQLSYKISRVLRKFDIRTVMVPGATIRNIACLTKDKIAMEETPNCVYVIGCSECDATYVGETKRRLKNRITEHKAAVRNANDKDSALSEHAIEKLHIPDWNSIKIVSKDRDFRTRRFKEAVAIFNQKNPLNRNEGMKISETFKPLITNFKSYSIAEMQNKFRAKSKIVRFLPNW